MKTLWALALGASVFAAHPDAKSEWWYYTGHLASSSGRSYGFELTFFRARLPDGRDLDAAHFAVTDVAAGKFFYDEKLHRPFPGIAGADAGDLRVYLENWEARRENGNHILAARTPEAEISLELSPSKPAALNGRDGISRKGPRPDEYSHYVTIPRLAAHGTLTLGGKTEEVSGIAWFDHEWGPGGLPEKLAGWDWFAIQLADSAELMLYRLRQADGSESPFSSGTYFAPDGTARPLDAKEFQIEETGRWVSPQTRATYPSGWKLRVPALALELTVAPSVKAQELVTRKSTRVTYWEGACAVVGTRGGRPVQGKSYVELTGYAGRDLP